MRRDDGFTLIELLIVVMVMGLIILTIGEALWVGIRTTADTETRLRESGDEQLAATYLAPDMQSATDVSVAAGATECSGGLTVVARFSWVEDTGSGDLNKTASYIVQTVSGERQLIRRFCQSSSTITSGTSPISTVKVADRLDLAVNPVLACTPACPGSPTRVDLTVSQKSGRQFSVTARRRVT